MDKSPVKNSAQDRMATKADTETAGRSKGAEYIDIKDRAPNDGLIGILEGLLAHAKAGKLRTMVALYGWDDDSWSNGWAIDERNSRRRMIGEMTMLNYDVLTNQAFADGDTVLSRAFDCE